MDATLACDEKKVAEILEEAHDRELPFLQYGDENSLSCVITLCYLYARKEYRMEREKKSGKGYCDYFFFSGIFLDRQKSSCILIENMLQ